jgi:glycosyltransferase involved in cell wall biosynthesis
LGDFSRKQALAVAGLTKCSVLAVQALDSLANVHREEVSEEHGLYELRCHYRASSSPVIPWRKLVNLMRYWRASQRGWRRIVRERGKPGSVQAYIMVRPALMAAWWKLWHGVPFVIGEQSSEYLSGAYAGSNAFRKAAHHFLFRRAAAVTAVSEHLAKALIVHGLCREAEVIPNVVPGTERPLPPPGPEGSFLVVADLVDRTKNVSGVLRALHAARAKDPSLKLNVIGDGEDRAALQALAKELGLNGSVTFLGRMGQAEVMDHMARTGAAIVNSNVETFSVVTGEALALGRPVIATRCGGPQAFITPVNGVLIDTGDDAALSAAMLDLSAHAGRYDPARIRATVSDRFSPNAVGSAFLRVHQRLLHRGS